MGEYAPQAILNLADRITAAIPSAELSGVIGDSSHTYGYHRARNVLPGDDYSVQLAEDKAGDGWAASALDMSYDAARMKLVTGRLLASAKDQNDPRLNVCREFYGTLDGKVVTGWDTYYGNPATSDDSHLWHVHISFLRQYANDSAAMDAVYSIIIGQPYTQEDDVLDPKQETQLHDANSLAWAISQLNASAPVFAGNDPNKPVQADVPFTAAFKALAADVAALKAAGPAAMPSAAAIAAEIIKQLRG